MVLEGQPRKNQARNRLITSLGVGKQSVERIGRPSDDFRETLARADIERICESHGVAAPSVIVPERRGNEMVAYHLDDTYFLSFGLSDCTQRKVEVLRVLGQVEAMPVPKVIAWSEQDPDLKFPYMLLERLRGARLDTMWRESSPDDQTQLLRTMGWSMGRYHTTNLEEVQTAARAVGVEQWVIDDEEPRAQRARKSRDEIRNSLEHLFDRLKR